MTERIGLIKPYVFTTIPASKVNVHWIHGSRPVKTFKPLEKPSAFARCSLNVQAKVTRLMTDRPMLLLHNVFFAKATCTSCHVKRSYVFHTPFCSSLPVLQNQDAVCKPRTSAEVCKGAHSSKAFYASISY